MITVRFRRQASPEDYAFPVASMGAPTAQAERLTDPFRLRAAVEALADLYAVPGYTDDKPFECSGKLGWIAEDGWYGY